MTAAEHTNFESKQTLPFKLMSTSYLHAWRNMDIVGKQPFKISRCLERCGSTAAPVHVVNIVWYYVKFVYVVSQLSNKWIHLQYKIITCAICNNIFYNNNNFIIKIIHPCLCFFIVFWFLAVCLFS